MLAVIVPDASDGFASILRGSRRIHPADRPHLRSNCDMINVATARFAGKGNVVPARGSTPVDITDGDGASAPGINQLRIVGTEDDLTDTRLWTGQKCMIQ